tara:strand:- start:47 stop:766 length:720 start_codon:yes stop_codon:yes gene_type:complete
MEKEKKIKFFLGIGYLLIISLFLWVFFENFSLSELTSYEFIKNNRDFIIKIKNSNFGLVLSIFFVSSIIWVLLLGFGTPVCLLAGFIFGKWIGTLVVAFSLTIGATLLYLITIYFFKDLIEKKFSSRFNYLKLKIENNEFIFFFIYRFIGGIPFFIQNTLPAIFNIKIKNYFFGSLFGLLPQLFVWTSLGSGLEKIINENLEAPSLIDMILSSEIYIPIFGFIILILLGVLTKRLYFKK